ncbi:hypothetical protein BST81_12570 [Leptolyngbya sp. 'hensonii']|uniref:cyclic nucleotide-binding domain-containing protein n=1 Tax=Leptolyngbya sp. 'hensonii' TaxID=1922337 RepID=UPI00094F87C3|nr:cyclic nucleotide-binding domain-containing protein [Leptolyngbya sp. 'hensonii']OLP17887.1 hypothetical protein BST81_12570 [Leptolyngbya sp. 'hensonii']
MLNYLLEQQSRLPRRLRHKLIYFLLLAAMISAGNIVAYAASTSLFLSRIGPGELPGFYILLGILSVPVSIFFSQVIDRLSRPLLLQGLLWGSLITMLFLRFLVTLDTPPIYYGISISTNFLELLFGILLWTLLSDYFTSLELKRYAPFLTMAMTSGGLLGGILVRFLSEYTTTQNLLLLLPIVYVVAGFQLRYLERHVRQLDRHELQESSDTFLESLKTFPKVLLRYPIVLLLAIGTFVGVWLWQLSELQFLHIYSTAFPDEEDLTGFLGVLSAWFSLIELGTSYFITRPLIHRWGVNRMNLLYPITTLMGFISLAMGFQVPAAVIANINYDPLSSSIALPVQNLNYNAIPHRFIGRVRVIIDGLFYPASQAITGVLLLIQQDTLTSFQLTLTGILLSLILLGIGYLTGRSYLKSMLALLRSGSVTLDDVGDSLRRLPGSYALEIRELLNHPDADAQMLGLELAVRMEDPSQFLDEVQELLVHGEPIVWQAVVKFLSSCHHPNVNRYLRTQLIAESPAVRAIVLESLIIAGQPLSNVQLQFFLQDPDPGVRALACVAVEQVERLQDEVQQTYDVLRQDRMEPAAQQAILRVVKNTGDRRLIPMVLNLLAKAPPIVKREGLETLAILTGSGDDFLFDLVSTELHHPDAQVRAAALQLAGVICNGDLLPEVVEALEDRATPVRQQAMQAVAAYRDLALPLVGKYLSADRVEVMEAAIGAIGLIQTRRSEEILYQYLQPVYDRISLTLRWHHQIPQTEPGWQMLDIALRDLHQQLLLLVLHVLSALGYHQVVNTARQLLTSTDARRRANAVETLASIERRRFIQPLLPLLEYLVSPPPQKQTAAQLGAVPYGVVEEILTATEFHCTGPGERVTPFRERWIRTGALLILAEQVLPDGFWIDDAGYSEIPVMMEAFLNHWQKLLQDPDPLVRETAIGIALPAQGILLKRDCVVNRILFLKQISLFQSLSLDDLLLIDEALKQQVFLAGEIIFQEGSPGDDFHIVYQGQVTILKQVNQTQRELAHLSPGQYFGDMALFDQEPRSATAVARSDCTLLTLGRTHFHSLISQRPEIILQMCRILSLRLRETNARLQ